MLPLRFQGTCSSPDLCGCLMVLANKRCVLLENYLVHLQTKQFVCQKSAIRERSCSSEIYFLLRENTLEY